MKPTFIGNLIKELAMQNNALTEEIIELRRETVNFRREVYIKNNEIGAMGETIANLRDELRDECAVYAELENRFDQLSAENMALVDTKTVLAVNNNNLRSKLIEKIGEIAMLEQRHTNSVTNLNIKIADLENQLWAEMRKGGK